MDIKIRNYCLVVMGTIDSEKVKATVRSITINGREPSALDAKGILIATFSSVMSPQELNTHFKDDNEKLSFLIFDLDENSSGFNIAKKEIHEGLFGFIDKMDINAMTEDLSEGLTLSYTGKTNTLKSVIKNKPIIEKTNISKMTTSEKKEMMDKMLDNGIEKLTEEDKKLLQLLAK